jgi:tartrate dehydratase alpha subunit/fumarate hydratase class I-like protein
MPTISSVSPSQAVQGQALSVTITGTNLFGVTTVGFGSEITVNSFTVDNDTQMTASIAVSDSATVGTNDVSVTNAAGTATLTSGFTVNQAPPVTISVNPNQAVQGQTDNVTITGTNLFGVTTVGLGSEITVNSFTVDNGTQITASIAITGSAAAGSRNVSGALHPNHRV